jgi:hypothetical protein
LKHSVQVFFLQKLIYFREPERTLLHVLVPVTLEPIPEEVAGKNYSMRRKLYLRPMTSWPLVLG